MRLLWVFPCGVGPRTAIPEAASSTSCASSDSWGKYTVADWADVIGGASLMAMGQVTSVHADDFSLAISLYHKTHRENIPYSTELC